MTTSEARTKVKRRLDIDDSDTQFDGDIDDFVLDAVDRLWPLGSAEVPLQTAALSVDQFGQGTVTLSGLATPVDDVRKVEVSAGQQPYPAERYSSHAGVLTLRELTTDVTQVHIYGIKKLTLTTLPAELNMVVVYLAMSEFYNDLAGNKRKYNAYMQNGRPAVEGMENMGLDYETKAENLLEKKATLYGHQ